MTDNNNRDQRNFTDDDLKELLDLFWHRVQREVGKGILSALGVSFITFVIGAVAFVLALKFKILGVSIH